MYLILINCWPLNRERNGNEREKHNCLSQRYTILIRGWKFKNVIEFWASQFSLLSSFLLYAPPSLPTFLPPSLPLFLPLSPSLSVYVYPCVFMCVQVLMLVWVFPAMCRPEVGMGVLAQHHLFCFLGQGLSLACCLLSSQAAWLVSPRLPVSTSLARGLQATLDLFMQLLGVKPPSS